MRRGRKMAVEFGHAALTNGSARRRCRGSARFRTHGPQANPASGSITRVRPNERARELTTTAGTTARRPQNGRRKPRRRGDRATRVERAGRRPAVGASWRSAGRRFPRDVRQRKMKQTPIAGQTIVNVSRSVRKANPRTSGGGEWATAATGDGRGQAYLCRQCQKPGEL